MPAKSPTAFRLLHSADWHLGKLLYTQHRHIEFAEFLAWLLALIDKQKIDALLVAGDIFDSANPGSKAQTLYYDFLGKLARTSCRHVVITAGNHDSPSLLDAPKALLHALNIYVIGKPSTDVLLLKDVNNAPRLIVAPIPYLRDKDVRMGQFGDSEEKKQAAQLAGFYAFYAQSFANAQAVQANCSQKIPIIATGHFFATGAQVAASDDGMRDYQETSSTMARFVGGLGEIDVRYLPPFDYVALGHIHKMQNVGAPYIFYSGSPMALGFGEAQAVKSVIIADFDPENTGSNAPILSTLAVPSFRKLVRIKGDFDTIYAALHAITPDTGSPCSTSKTVWAEITYTGETRPTLMQDIRSLSESLMHVEILSTINQSLMAAGKYTPSTPETLTPLHVFEHLLRNSTQCSDAQKTALQQAYRELLSELADDLPADD